MKIAVTYEDGQIFQHFGHTEQFKIYEIESGKVVSSEVVGNEGKGHGELINVLRGYGVKALICGGIGGGAINGMQMAGIAVYPGNSGGADAAAEAYAAGTLDQSTKATCDHHGADHQCSCGKH